MFPHVTRPLLALTCLAVLLSFGFAQDTATKAKPDQPASSPQQASKQNVAPKKQSKQQQDAKKRAASLRKLADRLEIRRGATIADIGAGKGQDSWVFADIVGTEGRVFSVEITEESVVNLREAASSRKTPQVRPVLGRLRDDHAATGRHETKRP